MCMTHIPAHVIGALQVGQHRQAQLPGPACVLRSRSLRIVIAPLSLPACVTQCVRLGLVHMIHAHASGILQYLRIPVVGWGQ